MHEYIKPMLAAELSRPFDNDEWLFEKNNGGIRTIASLSLGEAKIFAGKNQLINKDFPQVVLALEAIKHNAVLDGEITDETSVEYYLFDILELDGVSLLKNPLWFRKQILRKLLQKSNDKLVFNDYVLENGCDYYQNTQLSGITAKKLDSLYHPGKISSDWLKISKKVSQDLYICGFTKPSRNNNRIGSIIAGYKHNNSFCYSGHIAASPLKFKNLYSQLIPLITEMSPFKTEIKSKEDIVWVRPELKCEVQPPVSAGNIYQHNISFDSSKK